MNTEHHFPDAAVPAICASAIWRAAQVAILFAGLSGLEAKGREMSPREAYNQGVQALGKGYLRESESWLLRAVGSQQESYQPPALYNLGHVRFQQGQELLKGESAREPLLEQSVTASEDGADAIARANGALKSENLSAIVDAYLTGRATRKQLRIANEDVQRALDLYGSVLFRWRRSVGDFRSSNEMRASEDAQFNAKVVERHIEELLKTSKKLEEQKQDLAGLRSELKKKMAELRKKIPDGMIQPGQGDPDEEDEDEPKDQPKPDSGFQDRAGQEGEKRGITPEIAQQILEALGLNGDRKLPIGGDEQTPPRDKKGKDW
jgi:hypothetical protein